MPTDQRNSLKLPMITAGIFIAAALVLAAVWWLSQGAADERPLRSRLAEMGVIATLDSSGRSISTVNLASIRDPDRFDEAFEIVLDLGNISTLGLNGMPVTNADLERIAELSSLVTLSLSDCNVGGTGYEPLSNLVNLEYLHLPGTQTTDEDLESLSKIHSLASIDLSRTNVHSDLSPLAELPRLKWLLLIGNTLNDGALSGLIAAPALTRVTLTNAECADNDMKALQSAKPQIKLD